MSNKQELRAYYGSLAETLDNTYTPNQLSVIQNNVAKGTTATELAYFLNVCKTMQLNPFNKEVWCYKDNRENLLIFAGRDGFLSKAQKNPLFNGMRSIEIREKDEYSIDVINNVISHKIVEQESKRGAIVYGVAIVFRKDGEPTIELADFKTYNKGYNTWKTHPGEMIKKVAESHALKKAFGISGIQSEYDWNVKDGVAVPQTQVIDKHEVLFDLFKRHAHHLEFEDAEAIEDTIKNKEVANYDKMINALKQYEDEQ